MQLYSLLWYKFFFGKLDNFGYDRHRCNLAEEETQRPMQRGLARFAVYRAIRLWGLLLRGTVCAEVKEDAGGTREEDARERNTEAAGGEKKRDGEPEDGRRGYQCGRWLLAAKWLQAANALTTSYNIEYKRNQKYPSSLRIGRVSLLSWLDPRLILSMLIYISTMITYEI